MSEIGEFHHTDGWYFKRLEDGSVRVRIRVTPATAPMFTNRVEVIEHLIPAREWASIVTAVARFDDGVTYGMATRLHNGDLYDRNLVVGNAETPDLGVALAETAADVDPQDEKFSPPCGCPELSHAVGCPNRKGGL